MQKGVAPKQLADAPELPALAEDLWKWFLELHNERGSDGMERGRITASQMIDWSWATGVHLDLWQRKAIRAIDAAWFRSKAA